MHKKTLSFTLALWHIPNVGTRIITKLHEHFPNLEDVFSLKEMDLKNLQLPDGVVAGILHPNWRAVESDIVWQDSSSEHHILTFSDENYPRLLREISAKPAVLFVRGDEGILQLPQLAMVGSRSPSSHGFEIAHDFASELSASGLAITSGLALGIDTASHNGALDAKGKTVAVLGTGIDKIYPQRNLKLAEKIIASGGALVSEFGLGISAEARNFPRRNRIISGLSVGTLVVEAAQQSGSLITARYALDQGREVFAIPGSIHNPLARGCHVLLRQGAKLVERVDDILEEIGSLCATLKSSSSSPYKEESSKSVPENNLDSDEAKLLECVSYEVTTFDILVERCNLSASKVASLVTSLELKGLIQAVFGGYIREKNV